MSQTRPTIIALTELEQAAQTGVELAVDDRFRVGTSDPMAAALDPFGSGPILTGYVAQ